MVVERDLQELQKLQLAMLSSKRKILLIRDQECQRIIEHDASYVE